MIERTTIRGVLVALALVEGLGAYALVLSSDHESTPKGVFFLFILLGWVFIGSGLVAAARRPDSRFGWLLAAVGYAWFFGALTEADADLPFTAGLMLQSIWIAFFVHAVLAYPDGRLEGALAKASAALVYAICTVAQVFGVLWLLPVREIDDCVAGNCPRNLALVSANHDLYAAVGVTQDSLGGLVGLAALWVLARRWRQASTPLRRALGPVIVSAATFMVGFIVLLILDLTIGLPEGLVTAAILVLYATVPLAFLGGLLRTRLAQGSVAGLVTELAEAEPGRIRDALSRTLRDPSLQLAYWLEDRAGYVDGSGNPMIVGAAPGRAITVVEHGGVRVAAILHDASLNDNRALVHSASAAAGLALANERLQAELRARLEELRASRARIVEAGDAERRRLERNLHDGAQQRLVSLSVALRLARSRLPSDPEEAERTLAGAAEELDAALAELRELARGIHPAILDRGLEPALEALVNRGAVPVTLRYGISERLPAAVEAAAYYVSAEALTNVAKHAQADAAELEVSRQDGSVVVRVTDDGAGGAEGAAGSGLRGLRDRVEALDGHLRVVSPPGAGTEVVAEIPLGSG